MAQKPVEGAANTVHNERLILLILAAVQFITIVDFMTQVLNLARKSYGSLE